jgi:hypothetical protein
MLFTSRFLLFAVRRSLPAVCCSLLASFAGSPCRLNGLLGRGLLGLVPSSVPKWIINEKIRGFGEVLDLQFDPQRRLLKGRILLAGEKEPVEVSVDSYELRRNDQGAVLIINSLTVDRQWIEVLLRKLLVGKELKIPADKGGFILDILAV